MTTAGSIIDALGGTGQVAAALSLSDSTVSGWRVRPGGIPGPHWRSLVRIARERGVEGVTFETLAEMFAKPVVSPLETEGCRA